MLLPCLLLANVRGDHWIQFYFFCRYDPEADTAARGRASGSRADPTWGRANADGAGQQRVLRRRDPRGHGGVKDARRDAWRDKDKEQLGTGASQGILYTIIIPLLALILMYLKVSYTPPPFPCLL